jgi:hypothetical protein
MSPAGAEQSQESGNIVGGNPEDYDPIEYFAIDPDIAAAGNDHARRFCLQSASAEREPSRMK